MSPAVGPAIEPVAEPTPASIETAPAEAEVSTPVISSPVQVRTADFADLKGVAAATSANPLNNLLDVNVQVTVELGRATLSIQDVLELGIGSVVELDRLVFEPVDLMVQGVRLARGEVVVVDDRFAIRIKEIADPRRRGQ